MPECGYCSKEFAADESYCHTLAAAMDCPKVDLVQRAVLTAVAESIEMGATVDLGDGQFQKVPGAEDAAIAHHRAELYRSQSELLDQLVKAHQAGDAAEVDLLLDRLTVAHMAVTFEELIDYRASQTGATVEEKKRSAG
jgi:hypothetical protein